MNGGEDCDDDNMDSWSIACTSEFNCSFSHFQGAIFGLIPSDKAGRMYKDTTLNASDARKVLVSDPAPSLRQCLTTLEAFRGYGDRLNAPIATSFVWIDDIVGLRMCWHG